MILSIDIINPSATQAWGSASAMPVSRSEHVMVHALVGSEQVQLPPKHDNRLDFHHH